MSTLTKLAGFGCTLACCALLLGGCGEDRAQKEQKKEGATVQQQLGKEAAQAVKEPTIEARKAAQAQGNADQAIKEAAQAVQPGTTGQEKRKLEGC